MGESVSFSIFLKDYFSRSFLSAGKTSDKVFDGMEKNMDDLDKKAKGTSNGIGASFGGMFKRLGGLAATLGVGIGLAAAVTGSAQLGIQAEQTSVAFTTMIGSAEAAKGAIADLSAFAAKTPYGKQEVLASGKQLLAFGFTADELKTKLTNIGDVASGLGQPLGDMAYLFGTVKTAGKAMTMDLNQFANRGVPIFEEVAKVLGISKDKVKDFAEDGKISYAVIEKAFENMSSKGGKFFNMMESQSQTTGGRLATMQDNLAALGEKLGLAMLPIINVIVDMLSVLTENLMPLINVLAPALEWIGKHLKTILTVGLAMGGVLAIYKVWASWTLIMTKAQAMLNVVMSLNPVGLLVAGIALLVGGLVLAWQKSEAFRGVLLGLWEVLKTGWHYIKIVAKAIWDFAPPFVLIRAQVKSLIELFEYLWPIIKEVFTKVKNWIVDVFGGAIDWIMDKVKGLFDWLLSMADKLGLGKVVEKIRGAFATGYAKGKDKEESTTEDGAIKALQASNPTLSTLAAGKAKDTTKAGLSGVEGDQKVAKNLTVNIDKLIESVNLHSTTIKEGAQDLQKQITEALINAVRDFETSY